MSTPEERVKDLNAQIMNIWEQKKSLLDRCTDEGRGRTEEETRDYNRMDADQARLEAERDGILVDADIQAEREARNEATREAFGADTVNRARDAERTALEEFIRPGSGIRQLSVPTRAARAWHTLYREGLRGRELAEELRAVTGDTGASGGSLTVPTEVASTIYAFMTASNAVRRMGARIITTDGGNAINFPKVGTHGIATQVANQDTAIAGTDAVLAQMTLGAYDYGQLVDVSVDLIDDTGTDIVAFVAENVGRAIGEVTATDYATGSGSSKPQGIMTAPSGTGAGTLITGGTVALGGTTLAQAGLANIWDKLIDLQVSVNNSYTDRAWLMHRSTAGTIQKLRDGAGGTVGAYLWQPSPTVGLSGGQPNALLGDPVWTDSNVAQFGSNNRIIGHGSPRTFYIRDAGGIEFVASDDFRFDKRQRSFRGLLRTDSDLIDDVGWNIIKMSL